MSSCCSPQRGPGQPSAAAAPARLVEGDRLGRHDLVQEAVPAQRFAMGDAHDDGVPGDGETPVHPVRLEGFAIDATAVTVADFAAYVDATGHRTEAEAFGYSAVFHLHLAEGDRNAIVGQPPATPWWYGVTGADWRHPDGPSSGIDGRQDHPVTHVTWHDAVAYCVWAGRRLPTEAEWEAAARGGVSGARYPWGDETPHEPWPCNIFQGSFPSTDSAADGWAGTAPVRAYPAFGYGLHQSIGNVWEWCGDWFAANWYARSPVDAPVGPADGTSRVLRGGSFLCHDSYCRRYRLAARSSNTPDSSASNIGFRTVALAAPGSTRAAVPPADT